MVTPGGPGQGLVFERQSGRGWREVLQGESGDGGSLICFLYLYIFFPIKAEDIVERGPQDLRCSVWGGRSGCH